MPGNTRRGRPQGKCHRKYTANLFRSSGRAARVKRCGKSAPRRRQRRRQGKPHREQDQVGAAGTPEISGAARRAFAPPLGSVAGGARQRASQRNGHPRRRIAPAAGQNPAYTPSGTTARFSNIETTQFVALAIFCHGDPLLCDRDLSGNYMMCLNWIQYRTSKIQSFIFMTH